MEFTAKISPDGKEVILLYHDDSPLAGIGHKQVIRASNIIFDEDMQLWFVVEKRPNGMDELWSRGFVRRADAIQYEIEMLEGKLSSKDTNYFKELFNERQEIQKQSLD